MPSFRFLHCADLHLDSPLRGLEADPEAPAERIRGATRAAFAALVDYAIDQQVAFVLAAGDLYDGDWQDWRTGQFLIAQLGRLATAGIPFIAIRGNHDAENVITRHLKFPASAHLFGATRPATYQALRDRGVVIHGQSFRTRAVTDNLAMAYPAAEPGMLNIGLLHTSVNGREGHENYAPCSLDDLRGKGYQYWALGHIHTREVLSDDPWIVFPGNTQGRHARETAAKGATLVTVQDGQITQVEPVVFDSVRWAGIDVDLTGAADEDAVLALTRAAVAEALTQAEGRLLAARIRLAGATLAHTALNRDRGGLAERIKAEALGMAGYDAVWVESVSLAATPPPGSVTLPGHLTESILALTPEELAAAGAGYARSMLDKVNGLREALGRHPVLDAATDQLPPDLLERAKALLFARLDQGA
jgi:DNA repair exonuclease SbcCD nuclease subunit